MPLTQQMVKCRKCGSDYCHEVTEEGVFTSWGCFLCGFHTSTYLKGEESVNAYAKALPKLYQDLKHVDDEGYAWFPIYRREEGVGEVYANIADGDWFWTAAEHVAVEAHEKELYKNADGSYRQYKADGANAKHFHNEAFAGALHYLGII